MRKYTGKYILSWRDKDNKPSSKVYDDYTTVIKARKWLIDNGATEIDITVEMKKD